MKNQKKSRSLSEQGFASLVIAVVLVLVLSLITVGFAELMRKETRSATDKHLSSQAYYAAESGINDAANAINAGYAIAKTTCGYTPSSQPGDNYLRNPSIGSVGVSYPCLLIDPAPRSIEYGPSSDTSSKIVEISGANPADPTQSALIDHINIGWQDPSGGTTFAGNSHTFTPASSWPASPGMLRVDLTPLMSGGINRASLASTTFAAFLYPNGVGAASAPNAATGLASSVYQYSNGTGSQQGLIMDGNCNTGSTPRHCNVTIAGLGQANYMLALSWVYKASRVTITAYDTDGQLLRIKNAQTMVDSTGKAQDVLRRVQVRIPSKNNYVHSDYGLEVMNGICKQFRLYPDTGSNDCSP